MAEGSATVLAGIDSAHASAMGLMRVEAAACTRFVFAAHASMKMFQEQRSRGEQSRPGDEK